MTRRLATLLIVLLLTPLLFAQGPTNPSTLQFTASTDHVSGAMAQTDATKKKVLGYRAIVAGTASRTVELGLPPFATVAGVPNQIVLTKDSAGALLPINNAAGLPAGNYTVVVETYGPDGTSRSVPPIPFASAVEVRPPAAVTDVTLR